MKITRKPDMRKCPVNLSLNTELVFQARGYTDNLSLVVESLLAEYIEIHRKRAPAACRSGQGCRSHGRRMERLQRPPRRIRGRIFHALNDGWRNSRSSATWAGIATSFRTS